MTLLVLADEGEILRFPGRESSASARSRNRNRSPWLGGTHILDSYISDLLHLPSLKEIELWIRISIRSINVNVSNLNWRPSFSQFAFGCHYHRLVNGWHAPQAGDLLRRLPMFIVLSNGRQVNHTCWSPYPLQLFINPCKHSSLFLYPVWLLVLFCELLASDFNPGFFHLLVPTQVLATEFWPLPLQLLYLFDLRLDLPPQPFNFVYHSHLGPIWPLSFSNHRVTVKLVPICSRGSR